MFGGYYVAGARCAGENDEYRCARHIYCGYEDSLSDNTLCVVCDDRAWNATFGSAGDDSAWDPAEKPYFWRAEKPPTACASAIDDHAEVADTSASVAAAAAATVVSTAGDTTTTTTTTTTTATTTIENLPDTLLARIFESIGRDRKRSPCTLEVAIPSTCRRWLHVTKTLVAGACLDTSCVPEDAPPITTANLRALIARFAAVTALRLGHSAVPAKDIAALSELCPCLEELSFVHALGPGDRKLAGTLLKEMLTMPPPSSSPSPSQSPRWQHLQRLDLSYQVNHQTFQDEDAAGLLAVVGPQLTHLNLNNSIDLGVATMAAIGAFCPKLRVLSFERRHGDYSNIQHDGLVAVAEGCCALEELYIEGNEFLVSDVSLAALGRCCLRLRVLKAGAPGFSIRFGDEGARAFARKKEGAVGAVAMAGGGGGGGERGGGEASAGKKCAWGAPGCLEYLYIDRPQVRDDTQDCRLPLDWGLVDIISANNATLKKLEVRNADRMTDESAAALALVGSQLVYLNLSSGALIGDAFMRAIASGSCPNLERLEISNCHAITDAGWKALADGAEAGLLKKLRNVQAHCLGSKLDSRSPEGRAACRAISAELARLYEAQKPHGGLGDPQVNFQYPGRAITLPNDK